MPKYCPADKLIKFDRKIVKFISGWVVWYFKWQVKWCMLASLDPKNNTKDKKIRYFWKILLQILQKSQGSWGLWPREAGAGAVQPGARPGGAAQPGHQAARGGDQAPGPGPQLLQVSSHTPATRQWRMFVFQRIGSATIPGTADHKTCTFSSHYWSPKTIGKNKNRFAIYLRSLTPRLPSGAWAAGAGRWWTPGADQAGRSTGRPWGDPGDVTSSPVIQHNFADSGTMRRCISTTEHCRVSWTINSFVWPT